MKVNVQKLGLFIFVLCIGHFSLACGGGDGIVLNDDTILRLEGLFYPVTDPENKQPLLVENEFKKFESCRKQAVQSGMADVFARRNCAEKIPLGIKVTDSKGIETHGVLYEDVWTYETQQKITYVVKDLKTGELSSYSGQFGLRGGCGLTRN